MPKRLCIAVLLLSWGQSGCAKSPSSATASNPQGAGIKKATIKRTSKPIEVVKLPGSERVFTVDLDGDGTDELLGAAGRVLWAHAIDSTGSRALWRSEGSGAVHNVAVGTLGGERALYVARGIGRGDLKAPITVSAQDLPAAAQALKAFSHCACRTQVLMTASATCTGASA